MKIEHNIEIAAPASRVWDLTIDIETWPDMTPTITSVERLDEGPITVGSQALLKQPGQSERVWTVTVVEPERVFAWSARAMGTQMTASHLLHESDAGTVNKLTVEIEGPLSSLVGLLVRRPIQKALATENLGFKNAAEATSDA